MTETLEQRLPRAARRPARGALARARELSPAGAIGALAIGAAGLFLLVRVVEDVRGKPLFEDEAVAGLVAARPVGEILETVWWERGGPPLHFLLSHVALAVDTSPFALRWLAVVFALATIPVCFDLGRRVSGALAGATAALVAGTSSLLLIYGSFGRMYSLYALASAVAIDLFVRALERRNRGAVLAAAVAAWLLPAIHPYGAILVAAEALVALGIWRGRPFRRAWPVGLLGLGLIPFVIADLRLADRFSVGLDGTASVATPSDAWGQVWRALAASAGGAGWTLVVALGLAAIGFVTLLLRRRFALAGLVVLALTIPPILLLAARTSTEPGLSPRHVTFVLPLAALLIGTGVAAAVRGRALVLQAAAVAVVELVLVSAPLGGIRDPRDWSNDVLGGGPAATALGSKEALAAPAAWLDRTVSTGAVVFPYSPVYFAALETTKDATALPYAQTPTLLRALDRVRAPVPELFVSVPIGWTRLDSTRLQALLGRGLEAHRFGPWLLVRGEGPFDDGQELLLAAYRSLAAVRDARVDASRDELGWYFTTTLSVLCGSLRTFGEKCPPRSLTWLQPDGPPSARPRLGN